MDENFPRPSIILLRDKGFRIKSIQEDAPGVSDQEVMKIALVSNSIILTFDRDYGALIFKYANENPPSVVFFREKGNMPEFAALTLIRLLQNAHISLTGAFTVVEEMSIRQRFYNK